MAEPFDPYYIWLGIPPEEQPADYYRLLGIRRFESNLDVIANAADQRVRHIRSMQTGKRQAESQRLLNEIAVASGTLLDPDQRNAYDANLRSRLAAVQPTPRRVSATATLPVATASTSVGIPAPQPTIQSNVSATPRRAVTLSSRPKSPQVKLLLVGVAIVAAIAAVVVVALILNSSGNGGPTAGATKPHPDNLPPGSHPGGVLPDTSEKDLPPSPPAPVAAQVPPTTPPPSVPPPTPPSDPEAFIPLTELQGAQTSVWIRKFGYFPWQGTLLRRDGKSESFVPGSVPSEEITFELGGMGLVTLQFEHVCPPAYLLQVRATRLSGSGELAIDVVGDRNPTCVMIDRPAKGTFRSGMEIFAGTPLSEQEDKWHFVDGQLAKEGEPVTITIAVERIHALFAQVTTGATTTPVARVAGINATSMTPRSGERAVAPNRLGLTTRDSRFLIQKVLVVPLVATNQNAAIAAARKAERAAPPVVAAAPVPGAQTSKSLEQKGTWEYGYGRVGEGGKVIEFHPLVYSLMTDADGTKSVLWGTEPVYSATSPSSFMGLNREGGHSCHDPAIVVIRRWHPPGPAEIEARGEVEHTSLQGDGIRAYLVTGKKILWSSTVTNNKATISTKGFLLQPHEALDFYVDCNKDPTFDQFKCHLTLDVRYHEGNQRVKSGTWDSIKDYRDPPPPAVGRTDSGNFVPSGMATARFVRIELPGKARILNLAEVQVYSGSENVAVKGNATQSSTGYDGSAKLANDGNTNGQYRESKSVSHTNLEDNPWWEVDLGAEKVLDKIVIWNRTDGGTDPWLQGYKVLALDASRNVIWQVSPLEYPKPSSEFALSGISGGTDLAASTSGGSTSQDAFDLTTKEGKTLRVKAIKKHDVLAATTRTDVKGTMKVMEGGKGLLTSGKVLDRAEFPMMLPSQYMIETTLTRVAGDDWVVFGLHVDDHPTALVLDGYQKDGYFSGLELVKGLSVTSPNNPTAIKGRQLTNDKWASLRVIVTSSRVLADLDGRRIFEWSGDPATLQRDPFSATPNFKNLSLGTWMSSYHIESLKVTSIEVADSSPIAKLAVPEGVALASAREKVNETFAESLAKSKKPEEKLALAKELLTVAETEKDRAVRFALLDLARNLAVAGQDVSTAVSVAESMTGQYEIDESQLKLETLKQTSGMTMPADTWEAAAELAAELATAAQDSGRLELADRASQLAMEHAGHSRDVDFKKSIKQMRDRVAAQLKLWEVVKAAEGTLQTSPDDPAANLAVGKWYCLHLGDWDKGIPQLAKSGEAKLAAAATAEKEARLLPAADAWSAAAETLTGAEQPAAQKHALELYQEANDKLTGLEQLKAAKRVAEMTELLAQSESQTLTADGITQRTKAATDALRPGLLVRIYASQPPAVPTPALGIIHSYGDFALRRDQLAQDLQFAPQRLAFAGIGYIDLDKDETITFRIRNGVCYVDGDRVLSNTPDLPTKSGPKKKNPDQVKKLLKRGRHSLKIRPFDAAVDGPDFRITREDGSSAISYSPSDLDAELAKPVLFHGTSVKGRFSLGNR